VGSSTEAALWHARRVHHATEAAYRLQTRLLPGRDPRILHDAWAAGEVSDSDLAHLIPDVWLWHDWPEVAIGTDAWLSMFRATGFLIHPGYLIRPSAPVTVYRGASEARSRGMAWSVFEERARQFGTRHSSLGQVHLYRTEAPLDSMLAFFERRGEGEQLVLDPSAISVDLID
jgi:hypothetical protein